MGDRQTYDRRRREFAKRLPSHYCTRCSALVYPEDETCLDCASLIPEGGWPAIQDGFDPWIGRVLDGRYLVTKRVGQGAMGSVYRAESLAISREFAVKIINFKQSPSGVDAEQIRSRLQREIEAISRLRNPHVVPFYELLELYDNFVGIVMDFVSGKTLDELVRKDGSLPIRRALSILRQAANGLHEAHEIGMIHRDVKPENIMLEVLPAGDDFVHVLDFGIVRTEDSVSMTKGFLGTPLYASPEQAMAGELDRRSDIYSLGAVMFFLLTGQPPFLSDNVYEILRSHVRTPAPWLRDVAKTEFPEVLEDLVHTMLAKSPAQRPQTLAEVIKKIDHLMYSGVLERLPSALKDSGELIPADKPTNQQSGSREQNSKNGAGAESSESDFHKKIPESSSFLVSNERDHTGPKAAIFRRQPSRSRVRAMVDESREINRTSMFDRVRQSNTGIFPIGLKIPSTIDMCVVNNVGSVIVDDAGIVYVSDGEGSSEAHSCRKDPLTIVPTRLGALLSHADGTVIQVAPGKRAITVFRDVHNQPVRGLDHCDATGVTLAGVDSGKVYVQKTPTGDWVRLLEGPPVSALAINAPGSMFAVARKTLDVELFNMSSPKTPFIRLTTPAQVSHIAFSHDGHLIALLMENDTVAIHMIMTGTRLMSIKEDVHHLKSISFNGNNELTGHFTLDGAVFGIDLQREMVVVR